MLKRSFLFLPVLITVLCHGQPQVIDKVIGVVGKYPVLLSDLQNSYMNSESQGLPAERCRLFELLVFEKLLVAQADRDSVTVTDAEVDHELDRRMNVYIQQFGSEEKLEQFYGKRTNVLKDEFRSDVQEQMIANKMKDKIAGDLKLTPAEVRLFYKSIPEDSLPLIDSEVELQQLVKKPVFSPEAKKEARELLESYRQRVTGGKSSMSTLARLYSEDPGSAREGGLITNVARGQMVPEFDAVAFRLKNGEVSHVFETAYGYHFIELVQRRGEMLDLRHILIVPKMSNEDFYRCKQQLDSLHTEIKERRITFEEAVKRFSDDVDTRQNAGLMINPANASTRFDNETLSQIDKKMIAVINNMALGEVSKPMEFMTNDGKPGFRILKLRNRIDPHRANMKEDYQRLAAMATEQKRREMTKDWIKRRSKITYIKLDPEFACRFENEWVIGN